MTKRARTLRPLSAGGGGGGGGGGGETTDTWVVSHSGDDGAGVYSSTTLSTSGNTVTAGCLNYSGIVVIGYYAFHRFLSVDIPNGATIDDAKLTLRTAATEFDGGAEVGDLDLYDFKVDALDVDDSTRPSDGNDVNENATGTSAVVTWSLTSSVGDDEDIDTPDISTVLQEIVNRTGWSSGNDITFRIYNTKVAETNPLNADTCYFQTFDYGEDADKAAKLVVTYTPA